MSPTRTVPHLPAPNAPRAARGRVPPRRLADDRAGLVVLLVGDRAELVVLVGVGRG